MAQVVCPLVEPALEMGGVMLVTWRVETRGWRASLLREKDPTGGF